MEIEGGAWHVYGDYALYAAAASAFVFVMLYMVLSPWWRTAAGRNIMAVMGALGAGLVYFGWIVLRGGVPAGFWPARALLFTAMFLAIGWRVVLFIREHVLARWKEQESERNR